MQVGGVHIFGYSVERSDRPFSLLTSALVVCLLAAWGWVFLALLFAAFADFGSAAMNFVSTNISISAS